MRTLVALAIAGALGAIARYGIEGWVSERTGASPPWGPFAVNITGAASFDRPPSASRPAPRAASVFLAVDQSLGAQLAHHRQSQRAVDGCAS